LGIALTSCSHPGGAPAFVPASGTNDSAGHPRALGYKVLYRFGGGSDGATPEAALVAFGGKLYGTTFFGGSAGAGTVFALSPSGRERVLYSFTGGTDGGNPYTSLIPINGVLYGDTTSGGIAKCHYRYYGKGCGTIFSVTTSGKESVLYKFAGGRDGATPQAGLIEVGGKLYGTTAYGGNPACYGGCGIVFEVSTSGVQRTVYAFKGGSDGAYPVASLTYVNGMLYGTTYQGGRRNRGTVFEVSLTGKEHVLYAFAGGNDGSNPWSNLVAAGNVLEGTTFFGGGGTGCFMHDGCGTVFSVTTAGVERIIDHFKGSDGGSVQATLTDANGKWYGAATRGGSDCDADRVYGCGTLYTLNGSGSIATAYRFKGGRDGAIPQGNLILWGGVLYGTTVVGGGSSACNGGCGTVFALTP
ncbi:MAG: hypothetical protein JOY98_04485, partial [Candidatus Eremiobacteraeota bacterium]|nr:hypothetical protein [Candidatus Eremiobacteraeota bacterium]